ncbi:hypothetical protein JOB18_041445 [Solea senegalensis]|uniref:Uncharacterized protein n=1 Tax=Solea senegalensis TaxID=28829 RepID=A0AAV6REJ6_SOLSE|nr:hypothetical protein JOB18_041445 [Solea senegalensis]
MAQAGGWAGVTQQNVQLQDTALCFQTKKENLRRVYHHHLWKFVPAAGIRRGFADLLFLGAVCFAPRISQGAVNYRQ